MKRLGTDTLFLAAVNRAYLICNRFQPCLFLRLTKPTPAEAGARRATAAFAAAAGDAPVRDDESTPPNGEDADGGNAAAFERLSGRGNGKAFSPWLQPEQSGPVKYPR